MVQSMDRNRVLTGRHVALTFAGFFGVVFAVNIYFVTVALSTHTGVVANEPYRKGLKYNERIAASEQQESLGWKDETVLSPGRPSLIVITPGQQRTAPRRSRRFRNDRTRGHGARRYAAAPSRSDSRHVRGRTHPLRSWRLRGEHRGPRCRR